MKTLLLMSIIWMSFALPALAARKQDPVRAVRQMAVAFVFFVALYWMWVAFGHTKYFMPPVDR